MKILLVGATGSLGTALHATLAKRGHEVIAASRSHADAPVDLTDPASIQSLFERIRPVDAVACAAGSTPYKPLIQLTRDDYLSGFLNKALGQIELVRLGLSAIAPRGSFTLVTGILSREPIVTSAAASAANGAVEAFVRAAALETAPIRVNAVSPSVITETLDKYATFFPGYESVSLERVVQAYIRSIEGSESGRIFEIG
ncbi:short chain dehydrogenase [Streptomyces sp. NPDC017991]|uniref:short chain dehydrogenase n=1 Tax=Streptomyces sp. NPDC017991 TaxID=3365026 RepID=UPI0037A534F9